VDTLFANYPQVEYAIAAVQLVLVMLGLGATLTAGDFLQVARQPRPFAVGVVIQLVIVPALAFGLCRAVAIEPGLAVGLSLMAAVPGGTISNVFTYLAKGSVPLSVSLTGVVTLCCLGTTPLLLGLLAADYLPATFEMPVVQIIRDITLLLLLPLSAGMAVHRWLPRYRERCTRLCMGTAVFFIVVMIVGSLGSGRMDITAYGWRGPLLVIGFALVVYYLSMVGTRAARFRRKDVTAIAIEAVIRNTNLALVLQATLFPVAAGADPAIASAVLFVVLFYGGTGLVFGTVVVVVTRRRLTRRKGRAAAERS